MKLTRSAKCILLVNTAASSELAVMYGGLFDVIEAWQAAVQPPAFVSIISTVRICMVPARNCQKAESATCWMNGQAGCFSEGPK